MKNLLYKSIKLIGFYLFTFMLSNIVVTSVLLLLNISISKVNIILSFIVANVIFYFFERHKLLLKQIVQLIITSLFIVIIFSLAVTSIYDIAFDGNLYHKFAVGLLEMGWNPIYDNVFDYINQLKIPNQFLSNSDIWVTCYPKASWYFAATIYSWSGNIETGKVINVLMAFSCWSIIADYLEFHFEKKKAIILSVFFIAIPAAVAQSFTYYVDGILGNLLFVIVIQLLRLSEMKQGEEKYKTLFILAGSIIICGNLKITGLCFAGVFCIVFYCIWIIKARRYRNKLLIKNVIRMFWYFVLVVFITVGIVGAGTYITNILLYGNPLYPYLGSDLLNVSNSLKNVGLEDASPFKQILSMVFVSTTSRDINQFLEWKVPFTVAISEIRSCTHDVIRGGAGVFFGGILIVSIITFPYCVVKLWKDKREWIQYILLIIGITILLLVTMPAGGQARYSPYLYLIPLGTLMMWLCFYESLVVQKKWCKIGVSFFSFILFLNAAFFSEYWLRGVRETIDYSRKYNDMQEAITVEIDTPLPGLVFNMRDKNIQYIYTNTEKKNNDMKYYMLNYNLITEREE